MTLGQGHGEVIQDIFPDLYLICHKYLRFSSNGFDMRGKSRFSTHDEVISITPNILTDHIKLLRASKFGAPI